MIRLINILLATTLLLNACGQNNKSAMYQDYQELHKHQGSTNYEVVEIIPKQNYGKYIYFDVIDKEFTLKSYYKSKIEKNTYNTVKMDVFGDNVKKIDKTRRILIDGTLWDSNYYYSWIINGDTDRKRYIDPFSNKAIDDIFEFIPKETDPQKWLKKFKECYNKAQYVYIPTSLSFHYFKIDGIWYVMRYKYELQEELGFKIKQQFPAKTPKTPRMIALEDLSPRYSIPPEERNKSLIEEIDYESMYYEKIDKGLISYGYSAGWWYLNIYMGNDTLKIKRYASYKDPELGLYKIPREHGGRDDVLFIMPELDNVFKQQTGGMYVIRPRNYKETEQYKALEQKQKAAQQAQETQAYLENLPKRRQFLPDDTELSKL